jgi:hypothetical protein
MTRKNHESLADVAERAHVSLRALRRCKAWTPAQRRAPAAHRPRRPNGPAPDRLSTAAASRPVHRHAPSGAEGGHDGLTNKRISPRRVRPRPPGVLTGVGAARAGPGQNRWQRSAHGRAKSHRRRDTTHPGHDRPVHAPPRRRASDLAGRAQPPRADPRARGTRSVSYQLERTVDHNRSLCAGTTALQASPGLTSGEASWRKY